ncbi:hypothetical protein LCGC14_2732960, partial [marine sediment metagenome]
AEGDGIIVKYFDERVLKAEAIKRVKACKAPVDFSRSDRCGSREALDRFPHNHCEVCQREIWFNNITEEDLT